MSNHSRKQNDVYWSNATPTNFLHKNVELLQNRTVGFLRNNVQCVHAIPIKLVISFHLYYLFMHFLRRE